MTHQQFVSASAASRFREFPWSLSWIWVAGFLAIEGLAQTPLVPAGATWRYRKGTAEASAPVAAWRGRTFDDSGWDTGAAPFHYGDGLSTGTELVDMRGGYTCVFLRRSFTVADLDLIRSIELSVDYDDGFVAWINGVEAARSGVTGDPVFSDPASSSHEGGSAVVFLPAGSPGSYLVEGINVLAVQAFNRDITNSTDFRVNAALSAVMSGGAAPSVTGRWPAEPELSVLTEVTVTFSEPVTGVDAGDLLINDRPAAEFAGDAGGAVYTFRFTQPPPGVVFVGWSEACEITDLEGTAFDTEAPSSAWSYNLSDTRAPVVVARTPAAGAVVGTLDQVELRFSEPVTGVDAFDLLVNGLAATTVTGGEVGPYVFGFATPGAGLVQLSWASGHGIVDRSPAANPFSEAAWQVTLSPGLLPGDVVINELVAAAEGGLTDEDGEVQDWVELLNRGAQPVDLGGWSLTDDLQLPGKWVFPARTLNPGQYLVVFASGKDRRPATGAAPLHANFRLGAFGEYLGLYHAGLPRGVVSELAPEYPEQRRGFSYGIDGAGLWRYFATPTPGAANGSSTLAGIAPPPHFTVGRGLFSSPFEEYLTTPLAGATLRYTTDGSEPTATTGTVYQGPLTIDRTTTLRAAAFRTGYLPSGVVTASYLFLDQVVDQPNNPPGFPGTWGTKSGFPNNLVPADYEMDPDPLRADPNNPASPVDPAKLQRLKDGLRDLPVVSVVMARDDMFGPSGLYPLSSDANKAPNEKPCSVEMIRPDGSTVFVIDAGLDLHGNASRNPLKNPKHGFKLTFKKDFGPATLECRLFPDSPAEVFDDLILRSDFNSSWRHWSDVAGNGLGAFQRSRGTRTRYAWSQETFRDMGNVSCHALFFHLFINGLYWGTYDFGEQPTDKFAEAYFGGAGQAYDVYDQGASRIGTTTAYNAMLGVSNLADNASYEQMKQYLDIPEFIDYMLLHFFVGHQDWGNTKNWYAVRPQVSGPAGTFKYIPWDQECILLEENVNRVPNGGGSTDVPSGLHTKLDDNAQYRMDFADRVFRHLLAPGGALTTEANVARWQKWQTLMDRAIVAESCRWGDYRRDVHPYSEGTYQLYTRENHWLAENQRLVNSYFVNRGAIVLNQLRTAGLYPAVDAPSFNQPGGRVPAGFGLTLSSAVGTIYFTTNGVDPRVYGSGAVAPSAAVYGGPLILGQSAVVKARVLSAGIWSALNEAGFTVGELGVPLRITEIMYHPPGGDAYEFVEIQNVGGLPLDLGGYSLRGVSYVFPDNTLLPAGGILVLSSAADPAAFGARYPGVAVLGTYAGSLDNGGERLALVDREGWTVTAVHYDDEQGWPAQADGVGASLEWIDPRGEVNAPDNWQASTQVWGSPGLPTVAATSGSVILNELMADNVAAVTHDGGFPDWVELFNGGGATVDLAGWSLSDGTDPRKFVFPSPTELPSGGYLVVWCDSGVGGTGLHSGFALGRKGDTVLLYDAQTNRVDALSYGLQVPDLSVGRVNGDWRLSEPTPGAGNVEATLASADQVTVNEWMASPGPGDPDWLELYNRSVAAPVALRGMYVATSTGLARIESLSFLPPGGYGQIFADESAGADHVETRLPAGGGWIALYDATGLELETRGYGAQMEAVSEGRLPDGSGTVTAFPVSASPGASNYLPAYTGPVLNEVMARNQAAVVSPWGSSPDWVELHNPGTAGADLAGMSLGASVAGGGRWVFPPGVVLPAGEFLVIWCDAARPPSTEGAGALNCGFGLGGSSGEVVLFNVEGQVADRVVYGFQVPDLPVGRVGGQWILLGQATPGGANAAPAALGSVTGLRINEWMADSGPAPDWFEIYNPDARPVDMSGLWLTDTPSSNGITNMAVAPLSFVGGRKWVTWVADGDVHQGRDHVAFRLDEFGESIRLYTGDLVPIDVVNFGVQSPGVSQGRLPDGAAAQVDFVQTPTPGDSNYLPLAGVAINEVLTHTDDPYEDAVELLNLTGQPVDVGGWYLSDSASDLKRFRIPDLTVLAAGGTRVFYQADFGPADGDEDVPPLFSFNSAHGDAVYLSPADGAGNLTGYRTGAAFGAAANGVSFGRVPTSVGVDFAALAGLSFGADAPGSVVEFRTGQGLPNPGPRVGPVVLDEIHYQPVGWVEEAGGEFLELLNVTGVPVELFDPVYPTHGWRVSGAVSFEFVTGTVLAPGARLVIVGFDPEADPVARSAFEQVYGGGATLVGPYQGRLSNSGEAVELHRPDTPQGPGAPDAGFVPYILVDRVGYGPAAPWPTEAAGGGASLQRVVSAEYGNDPANWSAGVPNPGGTIAGGDRDGDGLPDEWEVMQGTDPDVPDAEEDPDGDGMTNGEEYWAGTDPQVKGSALVLTLKTASPALVGFEFPAVGGRAYRLLSADAPSGAGWGVVTNLAPGTTNRLAEVFDWNPSDEVRFYRLEIPVEP